ncbi:anti-sigma factor [Pseudarthrobacter sp. C4D7]|uniref:anti-sigma factor n=1 Tax=Pseudarthrobacter sp. C4D7 TaxID=2735268 RepID=UPI0015857650|nr:anti-sigma factor [Pseudarthrobacter sp. C4D7]NUT69937.1 anti-sigma factor [Pseudarthrobacter sp. C4D7]
MRTQFPFGGRHQRTGSHLEACQECAAAVRRERQYLERLRDAPIPPASQDLTARLLERTHELAAQPPASAQANHGITSRVAARALALTAGGTMAAAGVLAVGAFTAAGDPSNGESAGMEAAFSHVSSQTPADGRTLSAAQLATLRSEGWACPELQDLGFHVERARALVVDGEPAVELRLSDGVHQAIVTEQHPVAEHHPVTDQPANRAPAVPGTAAGGNPAGQDDAQAPGGSMWSATYRAAGLTITYRSDLPAGQADDAMPILRRLADSAAEGIAAAVPERPDAQAAEPLDARLERGITKIAAMFTQ